MMEVQKVTRWMVVHPAAKTCRIVGASPSMTLKYFDDLRVAPSYRIEHRGAWIEHNHIEMGHADGDKPVVRNPNQAWWAQAEWLKIHTYSVDGVIK